MPFTAAELFDLRSPQVEIGFKYEYLDNWNRVLFDVQPTKESSPIITCDGTRHMTRTLDDLSFDSFWTPTFAEGYQPKLLVSLLLPEASDQQQWPLGVFMPTETPTVVRTQDVPNISGFPDQAFPHLGRSATISMVDQSLILDTAYEYAYSGWGDDVTDLIHDLLDGVSVRLRPDNIQLEASTVKPDDPITYPAGENRLSMIRDLAAIIPQYAYFNNAGTFVTRASPENLEALTPDLIYTKTAETKLRVLGDTFEESNDLWQAPNRYVIIGSGATDQEFHGVYDIPGTAPHSYQIRGWIDAKVIEEQGIANEYTANVRAIHAYLQDDKAMRYVEFDGPVDARHDTYDIVEFMGDNYFEQSWSMRLDPEDPAMHHRLARLFSP